MNKFNKLNDNDNCWCESNEKYCDCHKDYDLKLFTFKGKNVIFPKRVMIKNKDQIEGIKEAGKMNTKLLDYIQERIKPGITTEDIDIWANEFLDANNAASADLHYQGYPKSICTSVNDVVCHGIPSKDVVLKEGDIVNVDATTEYQGYYGDASRMFMIGKVSKEASDIVKTCKECLEIGVEAVVPWKSTIGDIGIAIEKYARSKGYSVVREFCGHGVGIKMHEDPYILHYNPRYKTELITPGMIFTIEPMINSGRRNVYVDEMDGWTVRTEDGGLSAQWEYTLLVTEDGVEILTK